MSIDLNTSTPPTAPPTTQPSIADALLPLVQPIIQQAVNDANSALHGRVSALEGAVAAVGATQVPPSVETIQAAVAPLVAPLVAQATDALKSDGVAMHQQSLTLINGVAADVAANKVAIEQAVAKAGGAVLTNLEQDTLTQRVIIWGIAGSVLLAALIIIVTALLGNSTSNRWIGAAPAALAALVLWFSSANVSLPKRTTSAVTAPTVTGTATVPIGKLS